MTEVEQDPAAIAAWHGDFQRALTPADVTAAAEAWRAALLQLEGAMNAWVEDGRVGDAMNLGESRFPEERPEVHQAQARAETARLQYEDVSRRYDAQQRAADVEATLALGRANKWIAIVVGAFAAAQAGVAIYQAVK